MAARLRQIHIHMVTVELFALITEDRIPRLLARMAETAQVKLHALVLTTTLEILLLQPETMNAETRLSRGARLREMIRRKPLVRARPIQTRTTLNLRLVALMAVTRHLNSCARVLCS